MNRSRGVLRHTAVLVFFLALACLQTWPLVTKISGHVVGQVTEQLPGSDVSIFLWNFWWVREALIERRQSPIYCDLLARPGPPAFVFPTLSLMNSLCALPLTAAFGLEGAYNVLILLILALTGWSAYLLVHQMTGVWPAALLAGLIYGTSPLHVRLAGQLNVFTLVWMPLTLLAARRFMATGHGRPAAAMGVCFLANALSCWYHAIALGMFLVAAAAVKVWQARAEAVRRFERKRWPLFAAVLLVYLVGIQYRIHFHAVLWFALFVYFLGLLWVSRGGWAMQILVQRLVIGAVAVGLFALPVVWPMYRSIQSQAWLRETAFSPKVVFSADLASYFFPETAVDWIAARMPRPDGYVAGPDSGEGPGVFPGFVAWLLLIAAAVRHVRRGQRGRHWLFLAAVFVIVSLGPVLKFGGVIEWRINESGFVVLPGMVSEVTAVLEGLRVFLRFAFPAYLCVAVFIGLQAAHCLESQTNARARRIVMAGMAVAGCLLAVERLDLPRPVGRVPAVAVFDWLRSQSDGTVLLCPIGRRSYENLYSQTRHEKPMVNPYISRRPEDLQERIASNALFDFLDNPLSPRTTEAIAREPFRLEQAWRQLGARWIVVDGHAYRRVARVDAVDRVLRQVLGLTVVYEDDAYRVYSRRNPQ